MLEPLLPKSGRGRSLWGPPPKGQRQLWTSGLVFGELSHFSLSKAHTLPNNAYSKPLTVRTCSCFSMYLWLPLCRV